MKLGRWLTGGFAALGCAMASVAAGPMAQGPPASPEAIEFFEKQVRPVLAEQCYSCHGEKMQMAGLRLDSRAAVLKGSDAGPVLVPGDPEKSRLIQVVRYDGKVKMPPMGKLPAAAIEQLSAWVKMGAPWPDSPAPAADPAGEEAIRAARASHWSFQPVRRPPVPKVKNKAWVRSPIDAFVLAKLEARGMTPAPPADRRTLIRRAYYDLIGLPPTAEEVAAFLLDKSPNAYEKVIDRLLASPHYGERWGRYWLDVARYADSKGYVFTEERRYPYAYTYRDWVVRAFNEDLPYDQFILQQLAADHLSQGEDRGALAAMGFLTLGRRFLNNPHDIIDDRIDVVTRGFMGLTVSCARCHDHKFDPIPISDYYSLYGVFASSREPKDLPLLAPPQRTEAYLAYEKQLKEREEAVERFVAAKREEALAKARGQVADYLMAVHDLRGQAEDRRAFELARDRELSGVILRRWQSLLERAKESHHPIFAPWLAFAAIPEAEFAGRAPEVAAKVAANADEKAPLNPLVARAFAGEPPASLREVAHRYGALFAEVDREWRELLDAHTAKLAAANREGEPPPQTLDDLDQEAIRQLLYGMEAPTNVPADQLERLFDRAVRNELQALRREVDELKATSPEAPPRAMSLEDAPSPVNPRVFLRGNPNNPGPEVPRQFLRVLAGDQRKPFRQGSGRLELARAIASKQNPLTARVMVNRVWLHHFGAGLVRTPSDFGLRGEPPTHPELLDYLAWRFMADGWSIKKLHRLIMLSSTYRQGSAEHPRYALLDPENRLLWRMNRRRLDFEAMRDSLLFASGQLDRTLGGPAVEITTPPFSGRRTIYGFIDRQNLPGLFRNFDFASPDSHSPQRYVTTVPQQALFLMNSPFVIEQARALVRRLEIAAAGDPAERVRRLYRRVLGRSATEEEVALGVRFVTAGVTDVAPALPEPPPWQYGFGEYDPAAKRLKRFQPLPHWSGQAWQAGKEFPDPNYGFLRLTATGGHPGNDRRHAAIRRWVAPRDGVVAIGGTIRNPTKEGDGVQAWIVSSRLGELGAWTVQDAFAETTVARVMVKAGDTIDFIVDCRENPESDSFTWAPVVRLVDDGRQPAAAVAAASAALPAGAGPNAGATLEWNANTDFQGPIPEPPKPLDAWEKYAQVLLLTNEFAFVD